jgi:hypothetical protein
MLRLASHELDRISLTRAAKAVEAGLTRRIRYAVSEKCCPEEVMVAALGRCWMIFADFTTSMINNSLPGRIHPSGNICLRHLGEARQNPAVRQGWRARHEEISMQVTCLAL